MPAYECAGTRGSCGVRRNSSCRFHADSVVFRPKLLISRWRCICLSVPDWAGSVMKRKNWQVEKVQEKRATSSTWAIVVPPCCIGPLSYSRRHQQRIPLVSVRVRGWKFSVFGGVFVAAIDGRCCSKQPREVTSGYPPLHLPPIVECVFLWSEG